MPAHKQVDTTAAEAAARALVAAPPGERAARTRSLVQALRACPAARERCCTPAVFNAITRSESTDEQRLWSLCAIVELATPESGPAAHTLFGSSSAVMFVVSTGNAAASREQCMGVAAAVCALGRLGTSTQTALVANNALSMLLSLRVVCAGDNESRARVEDAIHATNYAGSRTSELELVKVLGKGSFGDVVRVRKGLVGQDYALKLLRYDVDAQRTAALGEFRVCMDISHRSVVRTYDVWETGGCIFLLMGLCDGTELSKRIDNDIVTDEHFYASNPDEFFDAATALVDALCHLAERRIVHHDLKPANIILVGGTRPVIVDFGLSRQTRGTSMQASVTRKSVVGGTREYMSPEQARAFLQLDNSDRIEHVSDVYSLGIVFYEMIFLHLPFDSESTSEGMLRKLATTPITVVGLPGMNPDALDLLRFMLEFEMRRRPTAAMTRDWMRARGVWREAR